MRVAEISFDQTCKVRLVVEISETEPFLTTQAPAMPRILFKMFPYLAAQRCFNDQGQSFRREALATEIPHLFEHLLLEIQKQVRRGIYADISISGETEWNWQIDPRGRFHVTVGYDNEIVALASIRLAERIINALDSKDVRMIDVEREIRRLRELVKVSHRFIPPVRASGAGYVDAGDEETSDEDMVAAAEAK